MGVRRAFVPLALTALALAVAAPAQSDTSAPTPGTGFEICTVAASCKTGWGFGEFGGDVSSVADVATDGAGNVYVVDWDRAQKFDSSGNWERAWGKDVVAGGGTGFEVCTVALNCKRGEFGQLGGELTYPGAIAADGAGNVYVIDIIGNRIQKFDSSGNWERTWGKDVVAGGGTGFEVCAVAADCKWGAAGQLASGHFALHRRGRTF